MCCSRCRRPQGPGKFPRRKNHLSHFQGKCPVAEGFSGGGRSHHAGSRPLSERKSHDHFVGGVFLFRRLRRGKFSLVVDFQGYGETAWLAWLSGAPQRWGSVYGPGRRWAYTRGVTRNDRLHHVDRYLSLLEQCGLHPGEILNEFVLPDGALNEARQFFVAHNLNAAKPTLFIQPFTSSPQKNWPLENYVSIARHWRSHGVQVLFGGGPSERAALEPVHQAGFPVSAGVPLLVTGG